MELCLSRSFANHLVNDVTIELGACSRLGKGARIGLYKGLKLAQVVKAHSAEPIQDGGKVLPRHDAAPSAHRRRSATRVHARATWKKAQRSGIAHDASCGHSTCISVASCVCPEGESDGIAKIASKYNVTTRPVILDSH